MAVLSLVNYDAIHEDMVNTLANGQHNKGGVIHVHHLVLGGSHHHMNVSDPVSLK